MKDGKSRRAGKTAALLAAAVLAAGHKLWMPELSAAADMPEAGQISGQAALTCFSFLRNSHYPAARENLPDSILELAVEMLPAYRLGRERLEAERKLGGNDPAFSVYLDNQRFFAEYESLEGKEEGNEGSVLAGNGAAAGGSGAEGAEDSDSRSIAQAAALSVQDGLPITGQVYSMSQLADYDFLMKTFYSVHPSTTAGRDEMNAEELLSEDLRLTKDSSSPQILIYHSHSQETYADFGPENPDATVVGVGEYLAELLRKKGYHVIHDTSVYDLRDGKLDRSQAYTYALEGITAILQENPTIEVVLDIHRDGVDEDYRLVSEVNGKPTAQIMFFNGMSQTPDGPIEYLPNPYREENLAFSLQLQMKAAAYFPGFTRKIYLKGLRYNLHVRPRSSLIEVGAQTNTGEEVRNAMEPLAELLDMVLQGN